MSDLYEIVSSSGNYQIEVGPELIQKTVRLLPEAVYIIDQNLIDRIPAEIKNRVVIEAVETNKALEAIPEYVASLGRLGVTRDTHLVAVGGGIIQDITTFIASIYMRGLSWTYLPTTVLSMADACIGGKSSINVFKFKNLVGNFYPPKEIYIDLSFISTLSEDMIIGGLFEAAKICYAKDQECFSRYISLQPSASASQEKMRAIIGLSLATKKWFIEVDEFDRNERLLLNFGHTFGHALEAATDFEVHHGIGVGVGMLAACLFSEKKYSLSVKGKNSVNALRRHIIAMLVKNDGKLVVLPKQIDLNLVLEKFDYDKKHRANAYRVVIPNEDGRLELVALEKNQATRADIRHVYQEALTNIGWSFY